MNRLDTLKAAAECVCGSREEDYGSPEAVSYTHLTLPTNSRV